MLRIAQIESGARKARFADVDLATILENIAEFYSTLVEDEGMKLEVQIERPLIVHGDRELLSQLFANLIENALRHCPGGSVITCSLASKDSLAVASVCDNGPGIPENERDNVLRRLYRLETSRTTPGSGLGLSMVNAIADLHHATLSLEDNKPGLCVTSRFPLVGLKDL